MRRSIEEMIVGKEGQALTVDDVAAFTELVRRKHPDSAIDLRVKITWGGRIRSMTAKAVKDE